MSLTLVGEATTEFIQTSNVILLKSKLSPFSGQAVLSRSRGSLVEQTECPPARPVLAIQMRCFSKTVPFLQPALVSVKQDVWNIVFKKAGLSFSLSLPPH